MRTEPNYGLVVTGGAMVIAWIAVETIQWFSRRAERRAGIDTAKLDLKQRLSRAEEALREANAEIASVKAELAAHR